MNKFFLSACNFWREGCCNCLYTRENDKKVSNILPQLKNESYENNEVIFIQNDAYHVEKELTAKRKKPESPPKAKRQIKVWTEDEDDLLKTFYHKYGPNNWNEIAKHLTGRNASQCSQRWRRRYKPEKIRKNWTLEEDNLLIELVTKYGQNWQLIANQMRSSNNSTRTGKQVRERFLNKLDPKISKNAFTEEEDRIILEEYQKIGKRWSEIAKKLNGRPENAVKNRFYSHIKRKILKEEEENEKNELENENENENEDNDDNDTSDQELEPQNFNFNAIEEMPELENKETNESQRNDKPTHIPEENEQKIEKSTGNYINIGGLKSYNSQTITTSTVFSMQPQNNIINVNKPVFDPYISSKMEMEDLIKPFQNKMPMEEGKLGYDSNEIKHSDMLPNFGGSSSGNLHKGISNSTETEKLLKSHNTFEKVESYNSYSDNYENNKILKINEQNNMNNHFNNFVEESRAIELEEEIQIEIDNYLNN